MSSYSKVIKQRKKKKAGFLPEALQSYIARRIIDATALTFILGGLAYLIAIMTYSHTDPSWNTASAAKGDISNWMGIPGAYMADLGLQVFGLGSFVAGLLFFVWGLRIFKRQPITPLWGRFAAMIAAILLASIAFARVPAGDWLLQPYAGGSGGALMLDQLSILAGKVISGYEHNAVAGIAGLAASCAFLFSCAVRFDEIAYFATRIWSFCVFAVQTVFYNAHRFYEWVRYYGDPEHAPVKVVKPAIAKKEKEPKEKKAKERVTPSMTSAPETAPEPVTAPPPVRVSQPKKQAARSQGTMNLGFDGEWELPPIDLLEEPPEEDLEHVADEEGLRKNAEMLQGVLSDFNVSGEIVSIHPGPVVTLYELEPAPGTKSARVIGLSDDIARSMAAVSVRCSNIPGRNVIGIELPNHNRQTVYLRDLLETQEVEKTKAHLPLILGKDIGGQPIIADLAKMPHLLVAGTTGSGKSVAVNTMILSLLYRLPPEKCRFIMIDPKMLELSVYDDIPHLLSPVVTEPGKAVVSLKWAVQEMENRYRSMSRLGVRNIEGYNERLRKAVKKGETMMHKVQTGFDRETGKPVYEDQKMDMTELPYIVIVVDEFADLMLVAGKDVENAVQRLAQMARAAGIHLIMATQRPSVDVITGVIKANFPTRISFQVTSKIDSRTILGDGGAEQLLGMGDMLYMAPGGRLTRVHGPFVSDGEVEGVVNFLKEQSEPAYIEEVTEGGDFGDSEIMAAMFGEGGGSGGSDIDELYDQAVAIVARERKASTSFIQRHLQIGYNRAARIVDEMEKQGVIGPANHVGKREVLVGDYSDA